MPLTVTTIESSKDKELPGKGTFTSWKLTVHDGAKEITGAELFQRKDSVPPTVGQVIDGTIEESQYGPKVKRNAKMGAGFGPRQRDPKETAAIQRQHSQSAAVAFLAAKVEAGALEGPFPSMDKFRLLVDWFQRDIEWGVRLSQQPGYGKEPKVKEPMPTGTSDVPSDADGFTHQRTDGEPVPW